MTAPRFRNTYLWVQALPGKDVREIDEYGRPLLGELIRIVGKDQGECLLEGTKLPYHPHYIARIKEGMLLPMDLATAQLAGVAWNPVLKSEGETSKKSKPQTNS